VSGTPTPVSASALGVGLGLGLDVGGTSTRWALARADGIVLAEGQAAGFSGQQMASGSGRERVAQALADVVAQLATHAAGHGSLTALWAGVTGHDEQSGPGLARLLARSFQLPVAQVTVCNDVEIAARLRFAPGAGHLVYAGTGSIGVHVDARGRVHRVGGRGGLLGDEGSGYWIARQALARVWRAEDDQPGTGTSTPLAQHLFAALCGSASGGGWDATRRFVHRSARGEFGRLALAVAAAADADPVALALLQEAGRELARLANLLLARHGHKPVLLAGRAVQLHVAVRTSFAAALRPGAAFDVVSLETHRDAAQRAAGRQPP
jgi:glucosamine kinase